MKKTFFITFLIVFGLNVGCDSELPTTAEKPIHISEAEGLMADKRGFGVSASTSPVYTFAAMEEVGSSQLVRTEDQLGVKLHTIDLVHHQVMTLWWVIFK